ncbi:hypothetical protein [Geminocystis herdmanii]|uniref:hypothetical protein n=1 Tax=Geminocystis herdmanii TaxID=669359 RepID=UPI00034C0FBF|nr:hypothetical protein [Geminocystis herdmanii]
MEIVIVLLIFIGFILLIIYHNLSIKQIKEIDNSLKEIEINSFSEKLFRDFIRVWKNSKSLSTFNFLLDGYYERVLTLCEQYSQFLIVWETLEIIVQKVKINLQLKGKNGFFNNLTYQTLVNCFLKEIDNEAVREKILYIITLINKIPENYSEFLYFSCLDLLENKPDDTKIKKITLLTGRLYYSSLRPNRIITIYDEQAIQNDMISRLS